MEQLQMKRGLKDLVVKVDRLEAEMQMLIQALSRIQNSGLELGLKELSEGKYHTYKSVSELDKAIKKRATA